MTFLGISSTVATLAVLVAGFLRNRRALLPPYGWIALAALVLAEFLMFRRIEPVATYFTPIAWTAYILLADAAVWAITRHSRLRDHPLQLAQMALLSIPLWLVFEAYNLHLANWIYVGVPTRWYWNLVGYGWSYATITPAIFETADLVETFGWFPSTSPKNISSTVKRGMVAFGAISLILPLILSRPSASYLFALVWIGFVFLLEPINHRLHLPSLLGDLEAGRQSRLYSLLAAGWVCGWLWEFWNYWAAAKWYYIFPLFQRWKIFEMPALGYLGFLPFSLECFVMYVSAKGMLKKVSGRMVERRT